MDKETFDFGEALAYLKADFKVTNSKGNIYFMEDGKICCMTPDQYPDGHKSGIVKFYTEAILRNDWKLVE